MMRMSFRHVLVSTVRLENWPSQGWSFLYCRSHIIEKEAS